MNIIACINYQDQGTYLLIDNKEIWRIFCSDYRGQAMLVMEKTIAQPLEVLNYFKDHLK